MDIKMMLGVFIGAFVVFLLLNNLTLLYVPFSCWFNTYECGGGQDEWDHNCSTALAQQVQVECCMDVRMCGGNVNEYGMCSDKYCSDAGEWCVGVYNVATQDYTCTCKPVEEFL